MNIPESELDRRLARADVAARLAPDPSTLEELARATQSIARRGHRRRMTMFAAISALILGIGTVGAPAAAEGIRLFLAQSEWIPEAGGEILPDSEWVDTSAADLPGYVASIYPEWLPLPPGQSREALIEEVAAAAAATPALRQEVGLRRDFESMVYCGWVDEWVDAEAAGDHSRRDAASTVMHDATEWPAHVATDGGGIVEHMRRYAAAAEAGDVIGVQVAAQMNLCDSWDGVDRASAWLDQDGTGE